MGATRVSAQRSPLLGAAGHEDRDAVAVHLVEQAKEQEERGNTSAAEENIARAVQVSPDFPPVYVARGRILQKNSLGERIRSLAAALMAIPRNTAWAVSLLGGLMFLLLWGIWGALAAYLFAQAGLKAPLLYHDAQEGNKKRFYAAALSLGGFVLGFIPALLVAAVVMLPYLARRERIPLYFMAVWALFSYWIIGWGGAFLSYPTAPEVKAVVEVNEGRGNVYALDIFKSLETEMDFERGLTRGLALSGEGRYRDAIEAYEGIKKPSRSQAARIKINIANCWFRLGEVPKALEAYSELKDSGLVTVLYNLSQAYREKLDFTTGDRLFEEALKLDYESVRRFRDSGLVVADETLSPFERIRFVATSGALHADVATGLFRPLILIVPPVVMPAFGLLFLGAFVWLGKGVGKGQGAAFRCRKCHQIFCANCDTGGSDHMCSQCSKAVDLGSSDDPSERVARMISVRKRRDRQREVLKTLCVVPGLSFLAAYHVWTGFLLLGSWVFLILLTVIPLPFAPFRGMEPFTGLRIIGFVGLVLLYVANFLSVIRRTAKGWL